MSQSSPSLRDLRLSISQLKPAPVPTLLITVKNTNLSTPFTILTWNSPLDALLVQLGLVTVTPPGASAPLDIPTIMVKRRMPPPQDSLVTLEPGEETERKVEVGERFVAPEKWRGDGSGRPAEVRVRGRWSAVWPGVRREELLGTERLEMLAGGDGVLTGEYESEVVEIEV
ncbi:hypothetical protein NKR19_g4151 [Coniochaeta hoffmannii]|uniref:Uncharacterized protein n=1 Tax=Coniochaeta hoffmannii TaxID=91930 RepID=A0AA38S5U2_9PEZI|nr:hypothetical protein NKR19_g4151 [Coniochaeta hoffmannii]